MRALDLEEPKRESMGHDIPGMVSVYLVRLSDGQFLSSEGRPVREWTRAKLLCGSVGLLEAKETAHAHSGTVCIVNCTSVQVYYE